MPTVVYGYAALIKKMEYKKDKTFKK